MELKYQRQLYEDAFFEFGDDPKSTHWDRKMVERYDGILDLVFENNGIDIQDAVSLLDIVPGMIEMASSKYQDARFEVRDIVNNPFDEMSFDWAVFCGVFNLNPFPFEDMKMMLERAFQISRNGIVLNFISSYVNYKDKSMEYFDPILR